MKDDFRLDGTTRARYTKRLESEGINTSGMSDRQVQESIDGGNFALVVVFCLIFWQVTIPLLIMIFCFYLFTEFKFFRYLCLAVGAYWYFFIK